MKKIHTTFLIILIGLSSLAQPSLQWAKTFDGTTGTDQGNVITLDASGNVFVGCSSDGFGTGSDYLTIKYNSNGDTIWTKRYNGTGNGTDEIKGIKVDVSGNVYITGRSLGNGTGYDFVTVKYNSIGDTVWTRRYNGSASLDDIGYSLVVDGNGNVYVVGSSLYSGNTETTGITIKYNSSGVQQWVQPSYWSGASPDNETNNLVMLNSTGNIMILRIVISMMPTEFLK